MDNHHAGAITSNQSIPLLNLVADPTELTATNRAISGVSSALPMEIMDLVPALSILAGRGMTISAHLAMNGLETRVDFRRMALVKVLPIINSGKRGINARRSVTASAIEAIRDAVLRGNPSGSLRARDLAITSINPETLNAMNARSAATSANLAPSSRVNARSDVTVMAIVHLTPPGNPIHRILVGKVDPRHSAIPLLKNDLTSRDLRQKAGCLRGTTSILALRVPSGVANLADPIGEVKQPL
jgi:hypothetical protein